MAFDPSHLDTSVGALVRSGAAVLGIVLGGFVLGARPRTRTATTFGIFLVIDGLAYAVFALSGGYSRFPHKELIIPSHIVSVTASLVTGGLLLATFWPEIRQLRLPGRRPEMAAGMVVAGASVLLNPFEFFVAGEEPPLEDYGSVLRLRFGEADSVAFSLYVAALALVAAALLASVRQDRDAPGARARLLFATHGVLNVVILSGVFLAIAAHDDLGWIGRAGFLVTAAAFLVLPLCFLGLGTVGGWSRWVPVALLAAAFATPALEFIFLGEDLQDGGFGGIVTLVGMLATGYALFHLGLLDTSLPRPRAGLLTAFALAALFITAQLVQNFASSNFSLGTGAVVAGLAVLLANPLQRRIEGFSHGRGRGDGASRYRRLVETAWKDGKLGANERLLLGEARRQLGLDAESAASIDEAVAAGQAMRRGRQVRPGGPKA